MTNFETGISKDQTDLLIGAIDYVSTADDTLRVVLPSGVISERVETDSGISILSMQSRVSEESEPSEHFGLLELALEEEINAVDIKTIVTFAISKAGVSCEAKEEFDSADGHTDRTFKRKDIDKTTRNITSLLNRIFV